MSIGYDSIEDALLVSASFGMYSIFRYTYSYTSYNEDYICINYGNTPFRNPMYEGLYNSIPENNPQKLPFVSSSIYNPVTKVTQVYLGIPIYKENNYYGVIGVQLNLTDILNEIVIKPPSLTGYYLLMTSKGQPIGGVEDMFKLVFGPEETIESILTSSKSLKDVRTGFEDIMKAIEKGLSSTTISVRDMTTEGGGKSVSYYVHIGLPIRNLFYLLSIVKQTDVDTSNNWVSSKTTLVFRYSSDDSYQTENITLTNKSDYDAEFEIEADIAYTITPTSGIIKSGKSTLITIRAYVKAAVLPAFFIKSVGSETISCFETVAISVSKELANCELSDYKYTLEDCGTINRDITFHKDVNSTCFGGLKTPDTKSVSCNILPFSMGIIFIILAAIFFIQMIYTFTLIFLKTKGKIEIVYRTRPLFYIMNQISLLLFLLFFLLNNMTTSSCKVTNSLTALALTSSQISVFVATFYNHYVHVLRNMSSRSDYFFYFQFFIPIMGLECLLFFVVMGEEKVEYTVNVNRVIIPISICGRNLGETLLAYVVPIIVAVVSMYSQLAVERSTVGKEIRWFNRSSFLFSIVTAVLNIFEIYNAGSDFQTGIVLVLLTLLRFVLCVICTFFWGSYAFIKSHKNQEIKEDNEQIADLFDNPIKRSCLKLHMRELMDEEKINFYEKLMEFRKNTIHLAKNPSQANNPKIKTIPTKLWGEFEMKQMATEIYDKYIATNEIRLSESVKKLINAELSKISPTIFDGAILDIRLSISRETSQSFAISSHAKRADMLMKWFKNYEDLSEDLKKSVQEKLGIFVAKTTSAKAVNNFGFGSLGVSQPLNLNPSKTVVGKALSGENGFMPNSFTAGQNKVNGSSFLNTPTMNKSLANNGINSGLNTPAPFSPMDSATLKMSPQEKGDEFSIPTPGADVMSPITAEASMKSNLGGEKKEEAKSDSVEAIKGPTETEEKKDDAKPAEETKVEEVKPSDEGEKKEEAKPVEEGATKIEVKPSEEKKEEPKPAEETKVEITKVEEVKAEEKKEEPKPADETKVEEEKKEEAKPAETKA